MLRKLKGRFRRKAVIGRFTISAKRANLADQPQPEVARHRVIPGGFAIAERHSRSRSSFHLRSLAPRVFNSLTADRLCHSEKPGQRLFDEPAAFVAPHGMLSGTIFLRVRHGRAFPFEKIAGVQARGVPQKYQMHFLKRSIEATPCFRARPLFHAASDRST